MRSRAALFAALFLWGCDPLASPSYLGEPVGRLQGRINSRLESAPPKSEIILLWINWKTEPGTVVGSRQAVSGQFPAAFTMDLFAPPPPAALNDLPRGESGVVEPKVAFAWIVVMREGAVAPGRTVLTHVDIKGVQPGEVLGWAEDFVFAYLDRRAEPGSLAAEVVGGPLESGFHLMLAGATQSDADMIRRCLNQSESDGRDCGSLFDPLVPIERAPSGKSLEITLTNALQSLRIPLFKMPLKVQQAFGIAPRGLGYEAGDGG